MKLCDENIRNDIFYEFKWNSRALAEIKNLKISGNVLILSSKTEKSTKIIRNLQSYIEGKIIEVEIGMYTVTDIEEAYQRLVDILDRENISEIIHMTSIDNESIMSVNDMDKQLSMGVYNLFYMVKAILGKVKQRNINISVIVEYANEVTGSETIINPHNAALLGLAKVIEKEHPSFKCHCIDIDHNTQIENIIYELVSKAGETLVVYRNGQRYIRSLQKVDIDNIEDKKLKIHSNGVYVITGGLGGIGLEIAKYLSAREKVNIALINRSKLPNRKDWDDILQDKRDLRVCRSMEAILEIEETGSEVICFSADVSCYENLQSLLVELRGKYHKINGVIHSAGIARDSSIIDKDKSIFDMVVSPKIQGTWILDQLTIEDNLDFFIMFSSINSFYAKAFKGDYTAANSYLDSFASYRNKLRKNTLTINWTTWEQTGMAFSHGFNKKRNIFKPISNDDAINAFDKVLDKNLSNIIIGELDHSEILNNEFDSGF